ncbi:MAG TPA: outer membrane lipoprotein-sorting protein [Fimbriimonas sp.]
MTTLIALTALLAPPAPGILDYVQTNLKDATFVAKIVKGDQRELRKINSDFGQSYRFQTVNIRAKEPFMLRLEANVDDTSILYVVDGPNLLINIPRAKIKSRQNLSNKPGRRQTFMDFGLLTPSLFKGFFNAKFVRQDRATGDAVFDLSYADEKADDDSRHRIWVDPQKKIMSKREWYDQKGQQIATFFYENPVQTGGIWMPTQLTVRNNDNKVAGVTRYSSFKVNTGLSDSLFDAK